MKKPCDEAPDEPEDLLAKVLGLGAHSTHKSYYPALRARLAEAERFRAALDGSNDAILLVELSGGRIEDVNETACHMLRRPRVQLIGQGAGAVLPALGDFLGRASEHSDCHRETVEATLHAPTGEAIAVEVTLCVVRLGEERGLIAVARDITERKRAEDERRMLLERERLARAEAERANRLKDEFIATVSHELRTPLNAIQGWLYLARRPGAAPEQVSKCLGVVERNTGILAQIIADLLDVSRIASGKLSLVITPLSLAGVVKAALESLRGTAHAKRVGLHVRLAAEDDRVQGDAVRLQQVVWNILSNAIKFTPEGGRVDVTLSNAPGHVVLSVRDTGPGLPPEFLPHLFERFRQADASKARRHGGLGLGLAIVKDLVDLHHGTVRAENAADGPGACFTVELPAADADVRSDAGALRWDLADLTGVHVLVVEDEPDAREFVQRILEQHGAEVRTADSAFAALQALGDHPTDVVVSDIGMPQMDGYELMRRLRAGDIPLARETPAIALTAFARPEDRDQALRDGFQIHLAKPLNPVDLVTAVASLAPHRRTDGDAEVTRPAA